MKHIWVLRHAKAAAGEPGGDDHTRPLTSRGRRQGDALRAMLPGLAGTAGPLPSLVLCSTARRARQTAEAVAGGLGDGATVEFDRSLYTADAGDVVDIVRLVSDDVASVMVVGHNPTLHELCFVLVGSEDEDGRSRLDEGFPTAALAVVAVDVGSWGAVAPGGGRLAGLFVPPR